MDGVGLGLRLRALRLRRGLRQSDVAVRAGVRRRAVGQLERGALSVVSLEQLERIGRELGASIDVRIRWGGEDLDRLLDAAHAATVAAVVDLLTRRGWTCEVERSFSIWGERGSIDVLGWHPSTATLLVVEVKSVVPDLQAMLHGLDRKARLASQIAASDGRHAGIVGRLLVIAESPTSRGRVRRHRFVLDAALPDRGPIVRSWLAAPDHPLRGLLFLSNARHSPTTRPIWRRQRVRVAKPRPPARDPSFNEPRANR